MQRMFCPRCRLQQPRDHLFCVRCGASLPRMLPAQRHPKSARFFAATRVSESDLDHAFLRVSRYRRDQTLETSEGEIVIPGHHVRFSVWADDRALCALSLSEEEAGELADFLGRELEPVDEGRLLA
jgi:hypothetical protein